MSYDHWKDTRIGETIGGNGPDSYKSREALQAHNKYRQGSKHVYVLQGRLAPGGPYHMPGLDEQYELLDVANADPSNADEVVPVRNDVAQAGQEIVTLRYWRIRKGAFEGFHEASVDGVWPYFEKNRCAN